MNRLASSPSLSRRRFLGGALAASTSMALGANLLRAANGPEPLRVGGIGSGVGDVGQIAHGNIIHALCDIDSRRAAGNRRNHPNARFFYDFREMFSEMADEIDVVTISTPDHSHFPAALAAMQLGIPVFVQKPVSNNIWETRLLAQLARKLNLPTVMGNQGATFEGTRRIREIIEAGVIGDVLEVHSHTDRPIWPQGVNLNLPPADAPDSIRWDLFLAQVDSDMPYSPEIHPFKWRGLRDFGCGAIGDIAPHSLHAAFWALDLRGDFTVEASEVSEFDDNSFPERSVLTYHFPARDGRAPVKIIWQDGVKNPATHRGFIRPAGLPDDFDLGDGAQVFVGTEGTLVCPDLNGRAAPILFPEELREKAASVPRTLPRVEGGPTRELCAFIRGDGPKPVSSLDEWAGPLSEMCLVGNLAILLGKKIDWDSENLSARGMPEADTIIRRQYRAGWEPPATI